MIILQISPEFSQGTGVGGVVHCLEQEWLARGHDVRRFDARDAGAAWLRGPRSGMRGRLRHVTEVVWFSTIGTRRARRAVLALPDGAVSICHNDALAGDVYVNHGILQSAMRARGRYRWRMVRNPLHLFTAGRDRTRYNGSAHRVVVNLTKMDDEALRVLYPRLQPRTTIIGNGVDTDHFRPPTAAERQNARDVLRLAADAVVTVFVGNEFERKGLFPLVDALVLAGDRHHLVVVGGTPDMVAHLTRVVHGKGVDHRCHVVGPQDPLPYLWAADLLAQPSAYESYGLVVTEALAAGVPVLSTPVGCAPEVLEPGINGYLTDGSPQDMAHRLCLLERADRSAMSDAARRSALLHTWGTVAESYLGLFRDLSARRGQ